MLTPILNASIIGSPLPHEAVGICNPKYTGQKAANYAVFLRPSKIINTGLSRIKHVMTDCHRQLSSWPFTVFGIANLFQSVTHKLAIMGGGLKSYTGEIAMCNHTQKPTNSVSLNSLPVSNKYLVTSSILVELNQARGALTEAIATANNIYHTGLDALKGGES